MRFSPLVKPAILLSIAFGLGFLILYPVFMSGKGAGQNRSCQSNLKQIALACSQYLQDNDGHFPAISRGEKGWADALAIRVDARNYSIFHCPTGGKREARNSDYFLSARVANLKNSQLKFPMQTISLGEGLKHGGTNSHFSELPFDWKNDENSPAQRHLTGANYAFVDGHVKWIRPEKISTHSPSRGAWIATFAVR